MTKPPDLNLHRRSKDPRMLPVQVNIRLPFWYYELLSRKADDLDVSLAVLILDALNRVHDPAKDQKL